MNTQFLLMIVPPFSAFFGFLLKILIENCSDKLKKEKNEKLEKVEYKLKEFYYPIYINLLRENSIWNKIISIYSDNNKMINPNISNPSIIKSKEKLHIDTLLSPSKKKSAVPKNSYYGEPLSPPMNEIELTSSLSELSPKELISTKSVFNMNDFKDKDKIMLELDKEILGIHLINQKIIHENIIKINPNKILMELLLKYDEHITVYNILRKINPTIDNFKDIKFPSSFKAEYPHELKDRIEEELYRLKDKQNKLCKILPNNLCKIKYYTINKFVAT